MNSKKKNKHRPSKPNLNPIPKVESENVIKLEEKIEEKVESAALVEERVPEIISEVVTPSVEVKENENQPKKPKRNKGKKKNQDNTIKVEEAKMKDVEGEKTDCEKSHAEDFTKNKDDTPIETKPAEDKNTAPAARKKKNKNKKSNEQHGQCLEDVLQYAKAEIDLIQDTSMNPEVTELESKTPKKKNKKKKNRNDSEKSDKADEAMACTVAFQNIIPAAETQDESKNLTKMESEKDDISNASVSIPATLDKEESLPPAISDVVPQEQDSEKWHEPGNKNKKKNKKDKKHPTTTVEDVITHITKELVTTTPLKEIIMEEEPYHKKNKKEIKSPGPQIEIAIMEAAVTLVSKESINKDKVFEIETPETMTNTFAEGNNDNTNEMKLGDTETVKRITVSEEVTEISSKNKAKISKPVDKKRKEKETQQQESKITPTESKDEEVQPLKSLKEDKSQVETVEKHSKEETKMKSIYELSVKDDTDQNIEVSSDKPLQSIPSDDSDDFIMTPLTEEIEQDISDTKTTVKSESTFHKEETQFIPIPEGKMGKKRKKSPKPPQKDVTAKSDVVGIDVKEILTEDLAEKVENKENISDIMPSLEDIKISSLTTNEAEGSACDVTPYIHYPRCSSQKLVDNNNNTDIQEISKEEAIIEDPSNIPNTPFIKGSGETPILTPDISTGVTITEVTETPVEEKTDLKSKVMEVNQDMEDLRLSIERSLAGFTALENSEDVINITFEKPDIKSNVKQDEKVCVTKPDDVKLGQTLKNKEILTSILETQKEPEEVVQTVSGATDAQEKQPCEINPIPIDTDIPPICPARKDNRGKGKINKKKGKQQSSQTTVVESSTVAAESSTSQSSEKQTSSDIKENKNEQKSEDKQGTKEKSSTTDAVEDESFKTNDEITDAPNYEPIEQFEDALTSSIDDVNKSFEMIVNETIDAQNKPEINVTFPKEDEPKQAKQNPVSQPKNLLGHPDIPVPSNKTDYKKEKNKPPNTRQAKVKIKDDMPIEKNKESKESQTENKKILRDKVAEESVSCMTNENEEYVYKYSFRKVFLPSACQVCKKDLKKGSVPCNFCSLVFYCNTKHKDEDWVHHQALCFAVSTIVHLKGQKHIYSNAKGITGHNYRLVRMQMIVSCEKVLKRKLVPWEQEALLYPRMCADADCREWRQERLSDCVGCGQISYCSEHLDHLPKSHQRWCKSYSLYEKLVSYQQTKGRLEPKLPSKVMMGQYQMPEKLNEVLAGMYEEKIDMTDVEYAALTQLATAPLTAVYCYQIYADAMNKGKNVSNGIKNSFTIHVVGAELQFEADALNKWEIFFLHLRPDVQELTVVLIAPDLNPSNLPLDLLAKVKHCENCYTNKRRTMFSFQDKKTYSEYCSSNGFITPDIVCAFNASIQRSAVYNGKDHWPSTITSVLKQKAPFVITSYTMSELQRDLARIKEIVEVNTISEAKYNTFGSVRPDRNFISDDEMPLLFKNYCFAVCSGF